MLLTQPEKENPVVSPLQMFLLISLFCGCISCWAFGEIGARARLLWLRLPGQRSSIWQKLEQELWVNFALLGGIALLNVVAALVLQPEQDHLQHYLFIIVLCAAYDSYVNLCARLYQWPSVVQAIVMLASISAIVAAVYYGIRYPALNAMSILELVLLAMTLLLRTLAKWRFNSVDWLILKHAISKRVAQA
ncbi:MAG: hypothetical protein V4603_14015 [Pseudomonadota bacterium]